MTQFPRSILALPLAFLALATPVEATARKCTAGGVVPGFTLMVNGDVVREYGADAELDRSELPPVDEIARIDIVCLTITEGAARGKKRGVYSIITFAGARGLAESHLAELVEAQAGYFAENGTYAANLVSLGFFASRVPIPIEMTVAGEGWSAIVPPQHFRVRCQVAVGAALGRDRESGVPECVAAAAGGRM